MKPEDKSDLAYNIHPIDIKYIKYQANLTDSFIKLGINISESSDKILNQINTLRLKNNPVMLTKNDIKKILND